MYLPNLVFLHNFEGGFEDFEAHLAKFFKKQELPSTEMLLLMLSIGDIKMRRIATRLLCEMGAHAPISQLLDLVRSRECYYAADTLRLLYEHVPIAEVLVLINELDTRFSYFAYWELLLLLLQRGAQIPLEKLLLALPYAPRNINLHPFISMVKKLALPTLIETFLRDPFVGNFRDFSFPHKEMVAFLREHSRHLTLDTLNRALGNVLADQQMALYLLASLPGHSTVTLLRAIVEDPTRDPALRSKAMVYLCEQGEQVPLQYLIDATRWCILEGMAGYLVDEVERLGKQAPIELLIPLLGEGHNRLRPGVVDLVSPSIQC